MSMEREFDEVVERWNRTRVADEICALLLRYGNYVERGQFSIAIDSSELAQLLRQWQGAEATDPTSGTEAALISGDTETPAMNIPADAVAQRIAELPSEPSDAAINAAMEECYRGGHLFHNTNFQGCRCTKCQEGFDDLLRAAYAVDFGRGARSVGEETKP